MRLGMHLDMRNPPQGQRPWPEHYGRWLERIEEADRLGAPFIWLSEHHFFDDGYLPQCWTFAAAIAARTRTARIGTAVALLPLHDPLELAEQIALVDIISGGRIEPGFGVGYRKPEYQAFRGDFRRRYGVFGTRINELRALWGEVPGADRTVTPAPVQHPMPMWGGFGGPRGARLAGQFGLGLLSLDGSLLEAYRAGLTGAGRGQAAGRMAGAVEFFLADDPERVRHMVRKHARYRWQSYNRYMFEGTSREGIAAAHFDADAIADRLIIGTPEMVAIELRRQLDGLPVSDIFCWSNYPGVPEALIDRHLNLCYTRLAPMLAGPPSAIQLPLGP